ncbi:PadR family transcriptional regulator [Nocardia sp. NPDC046473]|uniref:PadR family transcriptional regulator n=1 Tax=Nocardia sp. NPDC046473 TaxID=3155733 RepID=UPI0033BFEA1C
MNWNAIPDIGAGNPGGFGFAPFGPGDPAHGGTPPEGPGFPAGPPGVGFLPWGASGGEMPSGQPREGWSSPGDVPPAGPPPGDFPPAGPPPTGFPASQRGFGFTPPPFGRPPRRGKTVRRGDVRTAILIVLADQPFHGYQIIQQIEARSAGMWKPSSGSVYPTLQQLQDADLVRATEKEEGRKVYELTTTGLELVEEKYDEFSAIWDSVIGAVDDSAMEANGLIQQVVIAASQVIQIGSHQQVNGATKILTEARKQLYRLLAEGDTANDDEE